MSGTKFKQIIEHPLKKPANVTEQQWQKALQIYDTAKNMGDKYPELTVAQAALETGWFKSMAGNYNYFGQKAGKNQKSVNLKTKEEGANGLYSTRANFRDYDTLEESIGDRIKKWGSKYAQAGNVQEALDIVVKNGYATASNYKTSVGGVLNSITGNKVSYTNNTSNNAVAKSEPIVQKSGYSNKAVYQAPNLQNSSTNLESSTASYEEPIETTDNQEVAQAKQEIQEKSFLEEVSKIMAQPQEPIVQQQAEQEYFSPDMPDPYNYIALDPLEGEEFQTGGTVRDNIPSPQRNKVEYNSNYLSPRQFTEEYIQSPKYRERLENSGYENVDEQIKKRLENVRNVDIIRQQTTPNVFEAYYKDFQNENYTTTGSNYQPDKHSIVVDSALDNTYANFYDNSAADIEAHEISHAEVDNHKVSLNSKDFNELFDRNRQYKVNEDFSKEEREELRKMHPAEMPHELSPSESKADMNALRYMLKTRNIYDAGKEDFTREHLEKLPANYLKDRLRYRYTDEDLIFLMNNVAMNEENSNIQFAQEGAIIDSRGQWAHPGKVTIIPGNDITMQGVDYPVLGIDNLGNEQMMYPGQDYKFKGDYVTEYPIKKKTNKRFQNEKKS